VGMLRNSEKTESVASIQLLVATVALQRPVE
jgi:hypothetical protein